MQTTYSASTPAKARMFDSDYVYIKGAPEMSFFTNDSRAIDVMDILPRNRPIGGLPQLADMTVPSYSVQTTLASLRAMTLVMCGKNGRALKFGNDFMLKLEISY